MIRAHVARYAASQPFNHASIVVAVGKTGATSAPVNARPSSGTIAGAATAFAGIVSSGIAWN